MSETVLTFAEVKIHLRELQKKYGCSNREFLDDPEVRARVLDEDEFKWEAYLTHVEAMREYEEELHREYLSHVVPPSEHHKDEKDEEKVVAQLALAA